MINAYECYIILVIIGAAGNGGLIWNVSNDRKYLVGAVYGCATCIKNDNENCFIQCILYVQNVDILTPNKRKSLIKAYFSH
jgi:hypothetical protein